MRSLPALLVLIVLAGCAPETRLPPRAGEISAGAHAPPGKDTAGDVDLAVARGLFADFASACAADAGKLWGVSLCGPMFFVDPGSRSVVANQGDPGGALRPRAGVFVGRLTDDVGIANTAVLWAGVRWTMIMWGALDDDPAERLKLMVHEAFHRVQPQLGLTAGGEVNAHLDTADGRFWLQMEWNALQAALLATGGARRSAVVDALTFRAARRARFPEARSREVPLEVMEGLAEYSGANLAHYSDEGVVKDGANRRASATGFVRSFAYVSGPLYGFLLDASGPDWRRRVTRDVDLGALLGERLNVSARPSTEADSLAEKYGAAALRLAEKERERALEERILAWRKSLIEGPVLIVDLEAVASGTFDPRRVFPLDDTQVVYTSRGLFATWGTLTITDGAILEDKKTHQGRVSLAGVSADRSTGTGWSLKLNPGWSVVPTERAGDLLVDKR